MKVMFGSRPLTRILPRWIGVRFNSTQGHGGAGAFGDFLQEKGSEKSTSVPTEPTDTFVEYNTNEDLRSHPYIKEKLQPKGEPATQSLLSSRKRELYEAVLRANGGTYINNQVVDLQGRKYRLSLSKEEQKALEPSVYVQSYRIKSSWKKMYMFLRMFRQMELEEAITQCQFSARRMARDVAEMLERGRRDAISLGMKPEHMHIHQIWVGKDGGDLKRMQAKGRGRTGIITHPYVHVKAILKDNAVTEKREQQIKQRLDKKLWVPLRNWKIKEDFVQTADYKW